jgi:acetoin utilization deacetylase AcuC-like enzyme
VAVLRRSGETGRVLVVDLDVHQENGTASIFAADPRTFTFSMHGARNYPWVKPASSLDVDLRDGTGDEEYMDALVDKLKKAYRLSSPELVFYLAGVDPVAGDRFGRLALTSAGLRKREHYVLETARRPETPLAFLPAGGYAKTSLETAELHAAIHREQKSVFG